MTASPLLQAQGVHVQFGSTSRHVVGLRNISLDIGEGERVALVGSNGSGKSTLLRVLHGLIRPSSGIMNKGRGMQQAMVFQRPHLLRMSVRANVALGIWLAGGRTWRNAFAGATVALQGVGLAELSQRNGRTLSGGEQQRVAMARALAVQPDVLFLDEPTSSLDPHAKREVELMMKGFCDKDSRATMVFASHNLGQVKRLASRVLYLEHGELLADFAVDDFFDDNFLKNHCLNAFLFTQGEI